MAIELPKQISAYFAADGARSPDAVAACFTADAVVRDVGENHNGQAAIRQWKAYADTKYTVVIEPIALSIKDGQTCVTTTCTGNFPGSPLDMLFAFRLTDEKISELEITL